jgi:hypothetical protein
MTVLAGFPMRDQKTERTEDGRPNENRFYNCVATSTADGAFWLTGEWHSGDKLKDGVYGEAWRDKGTAARDYVDYVASSTRRSQGHITRRDGKDQADLIVLIRRAIKAGHPTLITIPSNPGIRRRATQCIRAAPIASLSSRLTTTTPGT